MEMEIQVDFLKEGCSTVWAGKYSPPTFDKELSLPGLAGGGAAARRAALGFGGPPSLGGSPTPPLENFRLALAERRIRFCQPGNPEIQRLI